MALDGFIFDLDGVLIDSNAAHVKAWLRAFRRFGYNVEPDRLALEMGKGGDKLVPNVLGDGAEARRGSALRTAEKEEFVRVALEEGLGVAPGGQDLLAELRRRRVRTCLATSSGEDQLEIAERASRVRWRSLVDHVVTATDVAETKPAPDLVHAALRKLQMTPAQCAMLGDAPWDAQAATRAGVVLLGVTRGGNSAQTLLQNGARAVYADPADLLAHLDEALARAWPARFRPDDACLHRLMGSALAVAQDGLAAGELPIACLVCDADGGIIAQAHHAVHRTGDLTAHAELEALRALSVKGTRGDPAASGGNILVCTVEPCVMCTGAAMELSVDTIIFALPATAARGSSRIIPAASMDHPKPRVVGGIRAEESRALLECWHRLQPVPQPATQDTSQPATEPAREDATPVGAWHAPEQERTYVGQLLAARN